MSRLKMVLAVLLVTIVWYVYAHQTSHTPPIEVQANQVAVKPQTNPHSVLPQKHFSELPTYVQQTIAYLKEHNFQQVPAGYVGGREWTNYEKVLPVHQRGYYHEWDVHPKVSGKNRGTERLVTGQGGEIYYTNTHYGDAGNPAFYEVVQ